MGRRFKQYLVGDCYVCKACDTDLAACSDLISTNFQGAHGAAVLIARLVNVRHGVEQHKTLATGQHTIAAMQCNGCDAALGWKYIDASVQAQKYKIGHWLLEATLIEKKSERRAAEAAAAAAPVEIAGDAALGADDDDNAQAGLVVLEDDDDDDASELEEIDEI